MPAAGQHWQKCYELQTNWFLIDLNQGTQKARKAATKSIELDDTQAEGHEVLGKIKMYNDYDWDGAESEFKKALNLDPGNADVLRDMGILLQCMGRFDEAIRLYRQSINLDPVKAITYFGFGRLLFHANRHEEAIGSFKKALELNTQFSMGTFLSGYRLPDVGKP